MADLNNCQIAELVNIEPAFVPVDMHAATNAGLWVSFKDYHRCNVVIFKAAGTAGDDPVISINQALDSSGTSAKGVNFSTIRVKSATTLSQSGPGVDTIVTQTPASSYTATGDAAHQAIYQISISADQLDVVDGFLFMQVSEIRGLNLQLPITEKSELLQDFLVASEVRPSPVARCHAPTFVSLCLCGEVFFVFAKKMLFTTKARRHEENSKQRFVRARASSMNPGAKLFPGDLWRITVLFEPETP